MPSIRYLRVKSREIPPIHMGGLIDDHAAWECLCLAFADKTFADTRFPLYVVSADLPYLRCLLAATDE